MEIGFANKSKKLSTRDFVFAVAAVDLQMREDFCPAWGIPYWPVVPYDKLPKNSDDGAYPIVIMDDIAGDDFGTLGFHLDSPVTGICGRVLAQDFDITSRVCSHEAVEVRANPNANQWRKMPEGTMTPFEVADAVQRDTYTKRVTLFGETRDVVVSNFVLPRWFDWSGEGPYDFLRRLPGPFTMSPGGYMVMRYPDGRSEAVFASDSTTVEIEIIKEKLEAGLSRSAKMFKDRG